MNDHDKTGLSLTKNMSQTICLFRKYLLTKTQHNIGKTNMEESEAIKRSPPRCLLPPKFCCNSPRRPSLLEQKLHPGLMRCDTMQSTSSDDKSSTAQLTIFYSGVINVYDNVPIDKAKAVMLLARESSLSNPVAVKTPITDITTPLHRSNLPSVCKLQLADLPIARKYSLQRFLEKRRDRLKNKSPYASSGMKHDDGE